jgi:hypothetical protein
LFDYGEVEFACQRFSPKDLFVTISLSGEGAETLRVVRCAQAGNIQTLSVTRWENNALARMCQESLYVGTRRVRQSVGQSYELVSPILPNAYSVADPNSGVNAVMAFGGIPIVGCQGSVLTAILTALIGAMLSQLFGISEPVLFGIQLRFNLRQLLWYFMISIFSVAMCFVLTTLFAIPKEVLEEEDSEPVQQGGITRTAGENNEAGRDN